MTPGSPVRLHEEMEALSIGRAWHYARIVSGDAVGSLPAADPAKPAPLGIADLEPGHGRAVGDR